jgi:hypothetical protein
MVDIGKVIESFFIVMKEDTYVLIRIQALVALVTAMFFAMFIVDYYRCRSRSSFLNKAFKTVDSLSDRMVVYLIGSMQATHFGNKMFPVWAIVLVSLRASLGYLSGYGIPDQSRRLSELGNVIKFMGAGVLTGTRALQFTRPLWSLWALLLLKSLYRFVAHEMAIRSLLHGRNSEFIPEYMRNRPRDREQGGGEQDSNNDKNYLVCGESDKNIILKRPSYTLQLEGVEKTSLITLDKISGCKEPLLSSSSGEGDRYKDISVAFTLSRLLRCRFEDVNLQRESIDSTRNLIKSKITGSQKQTAAEAAAQTATIDTVAAVQAARETETMAASAMAVEIEMSQMAGVAAVETETVPEAETAGMADNVSPETEGIDLEREKAEKEGERVFKILELELAFTRDYFHTLYPLVFWSGLSSMFFSLLLSMATFAVAFWLAVDIRTVYHLQPVNKEDNFMLHRNGRNVDVLITWLFMVFMMFKEVWEMVTYLLSNWTRLLLVSKYVQSRSWFSWFYRDGRFIRSFYNSNIAEAWHGCMDQYDFLESYNYKPFFRKMANAISLGKMPQDLDGRKRGEAIKVPNCVKAAILQVLRDVNLNNTQLPKEIPSLSGEKFKRYSWACRELHTCSQVILVWHIATSLCEIELARESKIDMEKPGFLRSTWSGLKTFATCTSKPPYLVNEKIAGQLETDYHIAISLSRYCAYLQVFMSTLLPDSFVVPDLIFEETLADVRKQLKDCNLRKCSYSKLIAIAEEAATDNLDRITDMNIVQQGATLGKALIDNEENTEDRWKILAEVWADLLVHMAPSWNVADHKHHLESGGEFITLIWALLSHCGIEKSSLWDKDETPGINAQVRQENNGETSGNQHGTEQQDSETSAPVHQVNNGETSNNQPGPEQQLSETSAQVPQENNGETSNIQPGPEQQEPETNAQVPQENDAETNDIEELDEDGTEGDEEPLD